MILRSSVKKQLVEMAEYVDFPMCVYVYETGKVIAANRLAKNVFRGSSCQNVNLIWPEHKKLKLEPDVLAGKSRIFFDKEVLIEQEVCMIDMEVNVIPLANEHIVVVFFERRYKQVFRRDRGKFLPALIWKNAKGEYVTVNHIVKDGLNHYLEILNNKESATESELAILEKIETSKQQCLENLEPSFCQVEQVDFEVANNGFVTANRLPVIGKKGEYMGMLMIFKPIISSEDFQTLFDELMFECAVFRESVMHANGIVIGVRYEEDWPICYATTNFGKLGYSLQDVAERKLKWMDMIHPDDRERVKSEFALAQENADSYFTQKYRVLSPEYGEIWVNAYNVGKQAHPSSNYMRIVLRVTEEKQVQPIQRKVIMKKETYLDFLTGLPNRMKYETDAEEFIFEAIQNKKKGYVMALDLDDFKNINEAYGPEYGDILLKKISKELNDIPEIENYCYRVDGDEFLVFVRYEYAKQVEDIIQSCLKLFQTSWLLADKECFCSVSIGVTEYPKDSTKPTELLKNADAAVYEAKRKGKNRIQHYKKAVLTSSIERVNYEKHLRKAIAKGCMEFQMFFQPIVLTSTKKAVAAEALIRWYSPELGFIAPMNFISLSEYLGLIVPLGEYVLRETFSTCKRWNDTINPDFMVSVNLSVVQLVQPNIVDRIMEIVRITGVNTKNIILEVTESLAVEDMNLMKTVLGKLKAFGFSIALDDFGTGYSSLNHIMEMPLDYVKIDKSFVAQYGESGFNPSLLSAITELAHSVNMEVVVEGVETRQQMEFLMFLNTDKLQGYLYGKPMPVDEFEQEFLTN